MALQTQANPYGIELAENEEIEHVTKNHWMLLVYHLVIPAFIILVAVGLAAYRWFGGQFFVLNAVPRSIIDSFNVILLIGVALCSIAIIVSYRRKQRNLMGAYAAVDVLCLALFAFRFEGGRVFGFNSFEASGIDLFNRILIGVVLLMLLICIYLWVDWSNDAVVLTNRRVVHDKRDLFHRHVQDQIIIEKIESAKTAQKTYLTHWLDYGPLVIQATTVGRRMVLEMADEPKLMEDKIKAKLKKQKDSRSKAEYDQMITGHVYGEKATVSRPPLKLRVRQAPKALNWLFFDNPEVDDEKGEIIWFAHWIFVFLSVTVPFLVFLVGVVLLLLAISVSLVVGPWALLVGFVMMLICGAWGLWRYKDVTDDELQLNPNNVIKVDKLPFGPEQKRTAALGAIKNVANHTSFIGQLIGYGTIEIQTAGSDTKMRIHHVPDPREVVATIYEYMIEYKAKDQERALNDTLLLMHHFHALQKEHGEFIQPNASPSQQP